MTHRDGSMKALQFVKVGTRVGAFAGILSLQPSLKLRRQSLNYHILDDFDRSYFAPALETPLERWDTHNPLPWTCCVYNSHQTMTYGGFPWKPRDKWRFKTSNGLTLTSVYKLGEARAWGCIMAVLARFIWHVVSLDFWFSDVGRKGSLQDEWS